MANFMSPQHASRQRQAIYQSLDQTLDQTLELVEDDLSAQIPVDQANIWGIHATQVNLKEDREALGFPPSFFRPLSSSFLAEHPVDWACSGGPPGGNIFTGYPPDSTLDLTRELQSYMSEFIDARREGIGPDGRSRLVHVSPSYDPVNPATHVRQIYLYEDEFVSRNRHWQQEGEFQSPEGPPHIILAIANGTDASNDTLTTWELMSCVHALMIRYEEPAFIGHDTLPSLIMLYVGPKHGRILQAHHDGERLVTQFPPIMSFESEGVAPVTAEFLTRYAASTPEGTTGPLHAEMAIGESLRRLHIQ
ncbi:hypothetical protein BDV12DRAFT_204114 [Aspergillus spectabilis]